LEENFSEIVNKRKYARVDSSLPVQYKNIKTMGELPLGSSSRNVSEGGVCFKSNRFISLACRLVLEITLPTISRPVKAITKVAWIRKVPDTNQYELGNQFLEMTKEDRAHLIDFVSKTIIPSS
jgi:c-di-GMP-binding flagellar brake protein YcgR